jgi:hypothetical protein
VRQPATNPKATVVDAERKVSIADFNAQATVKSAEGQVLLANLIRDGGQTMKTNKGTS